MKEKKLLIVNTDMVVAYVQYTLFSRMPALASADGSTQSSDNTHSEFLCIMQLQSQLSQLDLILPAASYCYIQIPIELTTTKAQFTQFDFYSG